MSASKTGRTVNDVVLSAHRHCSAREYWNKQYYGTLFQPLTPHDCASCCLELYREYKSRPFLNGPLILLSLLWLVVRRCFCPANKVDSDDAESAAASRSAVQSLFEETSAEKYIMKVCICLSIVKNMHAYVFQARALEHDLDSSRLKRCEESIADLHFSVQRLEDRSSRRRFVDRPAPTYAHVHVCLMCATDTRPRRRAPQRASSMYPKHRKPLVSKSDRSRKWPIHTRSESQV